MSGCQWVYGVDDGRSHLLADGVAGTSTRPAMCGRVFAAAAPVYSVAPNLDVCPACAGCSLVRVEVGPPRFPAAPSP